MQESSKVLNQLKQDSSSTISKESHAKEIAKLDEIIGVKMQKVQQLTEKVRQKVPCPS